MSIRAWLRRIASRAAWMCLAVLLSACAGAPVVAVVPEVPLLRLSPASLGRTLALQQQLTIESRGQTRVLQVLVEADAQAVRLAALNMGQTAARLEWDGKDLNESRAPWWPATISGKRILSDLQLMLWPAEVVRAALPAGWSLQSDADGREVRQGAEAVIRVRYLSETQSELTQLRDGYRIRVDSQALEGMP